MPVSTGNSKASNFSNIFDRLQTVELRVRVVADGATDLCMGHDRFCMWLQVKWGNVPELAAIGSDC